MVARWNRGSECGRGAVGERREGRVESVTVESEGAALELVSVEDLGAGLGSEGLETGEEVGSDG